MKSLSTEQQGEVYLGLQALLWSWFPIISILALKNLPPLSVAAMSTAIAACFFIGVTTYTRGWRRISSNVFWYVVAGTLVIKTFYALIFFGLQFTTAGNASIIGLTEVAFAMIILGGVLKKERVSSQVIVGSLLIVVGAACILFQRAGGINRGDIFILVAMAIVPFANLFQKKALEYISTTYLMTIRSMLGAPLLAFLALLFGETLHGEAISIAFPFILINGVLLLGLSKIFWLEAIKRIPISKANGMNSFIPALTLLFAFIVLGEVPTAIQLIGLVPMMLGVWIISAFKKKKVYIYVNQKSR